jgi:hypothetical protein
MSIRITVDVENLSGSFTDESFIEPLQPLLKLLESHNAKATFFVVGSLAPLWRNQIALLSEAGHEIGLHGHTHDFLDDLGPKKFRLDLIEGKSALEDVLGRKVVGFRAPYFSLTKKSLWAPEILTEVGFRFSSSVLPRWNPQAGFAGAPKSPFRWSSGLVEFPVPTYGIGLFGLPLLGGAYVRLIPKPVFTATRLMSMRQSYNWSYCHPYDFDLNTKFERIRNSSWLFSKLLFMNRSKMLPRMEDLLSGGTAKSFQEYLDTDGFGESIVNFNPK